MKIIIMAGGKQKRYAPKTPKQFIKIDGVRIVERTISSFKDFGDVFVIVNNPEFNYLENFGCKVVPPSEITHELSKFMSSYDLWKDDEEVLFIWGDAYITDDAIEKIKNKKPNEDFTFFGIHSEMLALWVNKKVFLKFIKAIEYIKVLQDLGQCGLCGSWTLYRLLLGKDLLEHKHYTNFVLIEDESRDFDCEQDVYDFVKTYPVHRGEIQ